MGSLGPGKALGQEAGVVPQKFSSFLSIFIWRNASGSLFSRDVWIDLCNGKCWAADVVSPRKANNPDAG